MHCCSMAMTDKQLLSDHFTPWSASPYHLLHPFMQPIMPTTILVLRKNIFYSLGGAWAWNLKFEQLGPHREKQQNLEKQKNSSKTKKNKPKTFGRMQKTKPKMFLTGFNAENQTKNVEKTKNNLSYFYILIDHTHSKK